MEKSLNKIALCFILVLEILCVKAQNTGNSKVLTCYYNSESYHREDIPFESSLIDPFLCTHIVYSFMGMNEENYKVFSRNASLDLGPGDEIVLHPEDPDNFHGDIDMIRKTALLRTLNPQLKILLSIGGPEQSSRSFSNMARHIANRTLFIQSAMKYVDYFELDGLDIFWKYPGMNGGRLEDIETFVVLMKELQTAFNNLTTFTNRNYTLTAALGCTQELFDIGYNVTQLANYVDFFNLLCYDFNEKTANENLIAHHSPLFSSYRESGSEEDKKLNVAYVINYILEMRTPPEKIVLGISGHARTYQLGDPEVNDYYQPTMGRGPAGKWTNQQGFLSFFEICDVVKNSNVTWQSRYDHAGYKCPSMCNDVMWIGFDNEISAKEKVDFAVSKHLGGIFIDFIDFDDYENICESWVPYPLTRAIKERLAYHINLIKSS